MRGAPSGSTPATGSVRPFRSVWWSVMPPQLAVGRLPHVSCLQRHLSRMLSLAALVPRTLPSLTSALPCRLRRAARYQTPKALHRALCPGLSQVLVAMPPRPCPVLSQVLPPLRLAGTSALTTTSLDSL